MCNAKRNEKTHQDALKKISKKIQNSCHEHANIARGFCILTSRLMYLPFLRSYLCEEESRSWLSRD